MTLKTALAGSTGLPSLMQVKLIPLITTHFFHLNPRLIVRLPTATSEAPIKALHQQVSPGVTLLPAKAASTRICSSMMMKKQIYAEKRRSGKS